MGTKSKNDKAASLAQSGTLNTKPDRVKDELFTEETFFDSKDLLQVKYEMLRRVDREKWTVSKASSKFGFSRPAFYEAKRSFEADGLAGLIPKVRGPKSSHKLTDKILDFVAELGSEAGNAEEIAALVKQRFKIEVHPRSIARAIDARGKKKVPHNKR